MIEQNVCVINLVIVPNIVFTFNLLNKVKEKTKEIKKN